MQYSELTSGEFSYDEAIDFAEDYEVGSPGYRMVASELFDRIESDSSLSNLQTLKAKKMIKAGQLDEVKDILE